ncbi:MAG: hypothetical protein A2Y10_09985 [Planctomycetes bacterium GWF2_41_51]|nr:MAG: hypothetical protein A2Y10_09985 [Planctomycetes bacterium GWF2_41_51]HBG26443.1 hypothetical protein [Phycisphaerales bacterium]
MFSKKLKNSFFAIIFISSFCYADWKSDANARIENIRKRNLEITIVDSLGQPVGGIDVEINQLKQHFAFGTCISYSNLVNYANYRNFILENFNWAVCENETKWASNENTRDSENYSQGDYIYNWCNTNEIPMRGHTLFWEQLTYIQQWVKDLPYAAYPASSELLTEVDERIDSAVNHFKNKFLHWDVDNEMLPSGSDYRFYDRLGDGGRVHMYQRARTVDPNCKLFLNEYTGNSFGSYDGWTYASRANGLISQGAPIDALGIQGHINSGFNPQTYYNSVLQPLAAVGLPIWITEFDVPQADENLRADELEKFYRICFSHASVEGIIMWGFYGPSAWRWEGLVDSDWSVNAAGLRYQALMDEWTTEATDTTGINGDANFRGFHGIYEITLSAAGQPDETYVIELAPGTTTLQLEIETNLYAPEPEYVKPAPNPMTFVSPPAAVSQSSITMTATTATDESMPCQYLFECTNDPTKSSTWEFGTTYLATGLSPSTLYTFRVKARDNALYPNETDFSVPASARTMSPGANVGLLGSWITGLNHAKETGENRILVFVAHGLSWGAGDITSVSYGGKMMTKVLEVDTGSSFGYQTAVFILKEADIASAIATNFSPTWTSTWGSYSYSSAFFTNVNQASPIGATAGNSIPSGTSISTVPLLNDQGDMVIIAVTGGAAGSYTLNNGFTEGIDQQFGGYWYATGVAGHKLSIGTAITPNATFSSSSSQGIIGVVIRAALITYDDCTDVQNGGLALISDLSGDCYVNFKDLHIISDYWLNEDCALINNCNGADFEPIDGTVDFQDFGEFAQQWMNCNDPQGVGCTSNW